MVELAWIRRPAAPVCVLWETTTKNQLVDKKTHLRVFFGNKIQFRQNRLEYTRFPVK
jgi:hypothetical protein